MEEYHIDSHMDLLRLVEEAFGEGQQDIRTFSPLPLAFAGDAVYELIVRSMLLRRGNRPVHKLTQSSIAYSNAVTQAKVAQAILPELTDEEEQAFRRGANATVHSFAKSASKHEYKTATALESLIGYLYFTGRSARVVELLQLGFGRVAQV
ncbi:MAG: ribonuclease III [Clostridium sp.]|jgi:ribonuclease-3 family protein|nr:ribonuclease III [Clostridium sp.]